MIDCLADYLCNANIKENIQDNCDNPMYSGMEAGAYIFNKSDIDDIVADADNSNLIVDFTLKEGRNGYFIINQRNNPYTGTNTAVEVGDYRNTFTRTVSLFVPMDGADVIKNIIDPLANGRFVVVLHNQFVNDNKDNEFPIFGLDRGLVVSSLTQTKYENNDYWVVELQESGVPTANKFFKHSTTSVQEQQIDMFVYNNTTYTADMIGVQRTEGEGLSFVVVNTSDNSPIMGMTLESAMMNVAVISMLGETESVRLTMNTNLETLAAGDVATATAMFSRVAVDNDDTCEFLTSLTTSQADEMV